LRSQLDHNSNTTVILLHILVVRSTVASKDTQLLMKRLDAIINVLLETARPNGEEITVRDKVRILASIGLRPIEIARILGIGVTHVGVELHKLRKSKRTRSGKK